MGNDVGYYHYSHKGVDWVFVDHPSFPRPGGLYADEHGVYGDNQVSIVEDEPSTRGGTKGRNRRSLIRAPAFSSALVVYWQLPTAH